VTAHVVELRTGNLLVFELNAGEEDTLRKLCSEEVCSLAVQEWRQADHNQGLDAMASLSVAVIAVRTVN
jgi:hypothetical protein